MLLFMSMAPMKEMSLKKSWRVWKGNRKGQFLKICCSVSEIPPPIRV